MKSTQCRCPEEERVSAGRGGGGEEELGSEGHSKLDFMSKIWITDLQFVLKLQQRFCGSWSSSRKDESCIQGAV